MRHAQDARSAVGLSPGLLPECARVFTETVCAWHTYHPLRPSLGVDTLP